jgi:endonuclease-3
MRKQELYDQVTAYFQEAMPVAETELHYETPFQLLVAVILSAQCTDKRVNLITPALFHDYPNAEALSASTPEVIFEYIRSVSYPNNKAKHLVGMAQMLMKEFGGEVPDNLDDLVKLPGVGRKTANVMQAVVWGRDAMPVDTHVFRVSHRIGLVTDKHTTPLAVEKELVKYFPAGIIATAHHWLILHGRYTCTALRPKCETCGIRLLCKHYKKTHAIREAKQKDSK